MKPYLDRPYAAELLTALDDIAATHDVSVSAIAVAWLRSFDVVAAPVAGARTVEQLPALLESATVRLSPDEIRQLNDITAR